MPEPFLHRLRVRYGECDPQGIVFNANYLLYFDVAFTELWRVAVGPWMGMLEHGVDAVVAEAGVHFRGPARFDDELALSCRIARLGRTAITTEIDVLRGEELLVQGRLRHVCVSTATWQKTPWPEAIRRGLERFTVDGADARGAYTQETPS
jgi:acyl-CoA thioester hydrolase